MAPAAKATTWCPSGEREPAVAAAGVAGPGAPAAAPGPAQANDGAIAAKPTKNEKRRISLYYDRPRPRFHAHDQPRTTKLMSRPGTNTTLATSFPSSHGCTVGSERA